MRKFLLAAVLALGPSMAAADAPGAACVKLGSIATDGTGNPQRYRTGGTYFGLPIGKITPDAVVRIAMTAGPLRYVTLHTRFEGGIWRTAYQGADMSFPAAHPAFAACRAAKTCTTMVISINGAHERYEAVQSAADILLCEPRRLGRAPSVEADALTTVEAPKSGWRLTLPVSWRQDVVDDPAGGASTFTSPNGLTALGVVTLTPPTGTSVEQTARMMDGGLFGGAGASAVEPATFGGLGGELRRHQWRADGLDMIARSFVGEAGGRHYVVWALFPAASAAAEELPALAFMRSFQLIGGGAIEPLEIAMLAVGARKAGAAIGDPAFSFPPSAPEIHAAARLIGADRAGPVELALIYDETGYQVASFKADLAKFPTDRVIELILSTTRPTKGWPAGAYRFVVRRGQTDLGAKMFVVEETGQ